MSSRASFHESGLLPIGLFGLIAGLAVVQLVGCAAAAPPSEPAPPVIASAVYRRAAVDRTGRLEAEIRRLSADLKQAEEALIQAESGMRGTYSRADAVSALAESRIEVERIAARAPWRDAEISEARAKLDEAELQIDQDHFGAALFFIRRAERMAADVEREARAVENTPNALFVAGRRVNLRAGPSMTDAIVQVLGEGSPVFPEDRADRWILVRAATGSVGWIHSSLLVRPEREGR